MDTVEKLITCPHCHNIIHNTFLIPLDRAQYNEALLEENLRLKRRLEATLGQLESYALNHLKANRKNSPKTIYPKNQTNGKQ